MVLFRPEYIISILGRKYALSDFLPSKTSKQKQHSSAPRPLPPPKPVLWFLLQYVHTCELFTHAARFSTQKMSALRRKAEEDAAEVSQRLRQSEQRREELTDLKFAHEAELRELRGRSEAGEAGREAASNDAKALREANRALEARAFESEREAERLRIQGAALAQQVFFF